MLLEDKVDASDDVAAPALAVTTSKSTNAKDVSLGSHAESLACSGTGDVCAMAVGDLVALVERPDLLGTAAEDNMVLVDAGVNNVDVGALAEIGVDKVVCVVHLTRIVSCEGSSRDSAKAPRSVSSGIDGCVTALLGNSVCALHRCRSLDQGDISHVCQEIETVGLHLGGESTEGRVLEDMFDIGVVLGEFQASEDFVYFCGDGLVSVEDNNVLEAARLVGFCCCCSESGRERKSESDNGLDHDGDVGRAICNRCDVSDRRGCGVVPARLMVQMKVMVLLV